MDDTISKEWENFERIAKNQGFQIQNYFVRMNYKIL